MIIKMHNWRNPFFFERLPMDPSGDRGSYHKLTLQMVEDSYLLDYLRSCLWTVGKRRSSNGFGHDSVDDSPMNGL